MTFSEKASFAIVIGLALYIIVVLAYDGWMQRRGIRAYKRIIQRRDDLQRKIDFFYLR
jgi:hypothetical protein